jgi:hypothetical protein
MTHPLAPATRDEDHPGTWEDLCATVFLPHNLLTEAEAACLGRYKGSKCNLLFGELPPITRKSREASAFWPFPGQCDFLRCTTPPQW